MENKITANQIFLADGKLHQNVVIIYDNAGKIVDVVTNNFDQNEVEHVNGILTPGFINTHCHLELSHMKGRIDTGTGLIPFIGSVVKNRAASEELIQAAIAEAADEMYNTGIIAVGDISNQVDTFKTKANGKLRYYTFVECFDFLQDQNAQATFDQYKAVYDQIELTNGSKVSLVPHAPYSVSDTLYRLIREANGDEVTISIHNQETPPENQLFLEKQGDFIDFYNGFDVDLSKFEAIGKPSIFGALPNLNPKNNNLFVHNTLTSVADIQAAQAFSENVYWSTCANANLYIENRMPLYQNFLDTNAKLTIGTDSLTSNWQLNLLEEMKTIQKYQSYISLETMLTWATKNGAEALGFDDLGSFEKGKIPGFVLIEGAENNNLAQATSKRIK